MNITELLHEIKEMIIDSYTPIPFCNSADGIRLIFPIPHTAKSGTIFIGSLSDWTHALNHCNIFDGCTYLICCKHETTDLPHGNFNSNVLFLDAAMRTVLQSISNFFSEIHALDSSSLAALYRDFWNDIFSMQLTTQQQIVERIRQFPHPVYQHIACIVVQHTQMHPKASFIHDITQVLHSFFPNTNLFFNGKEWIILYSQEIDTSDTLHISYPDFSTLLENYQLDAGISYVCQRPDTLRTLYLTAVAAIDLGKKLNITPIQKRIYTYCQYNPYYVIHLCSHRFQELHKTDNLIYLTHPDITRLYYYDIENNSNLLDVLFAYLSCGQNLNQTSQLLFMHRNTVLNKLNKISEFLQHEPDYDKEHFLLLLSCMILKYQHNYTQRNISDYFVSNNISLTSQKNDEDIS